MAEVLYRTAQYPSPTISKNSFVIHRRGGPMWPPANLPPGHWALGLQNLPLVRFRFRAWLCQANGKVR